MMTHRFVPTLLMLLATGLVLAQDGDAGTSPRTPDGSDAGGAYARQRPPENATQEERRAFYQKRATERAKTEESGAPIADHATAPTTAHATDGHRMGGMRPDSTGNGQKPGTATAMPPLATAKPDEANRNGNGGRPGGMGMGMRSGGAVWLSDSPPMRGDGPPRRGMGGMAMGGERSGPPVKRLWLRSGSDPQKSSFYREVSGAAPEILLVTPQGKPEGAPLPPATEGRRNLSFEMPTQGVYRLYVTTRKLQGDTLNVSVAKAEVNNFSHGGDEEEIAKAATAPRALESAAIEIVREKLPNEKLFFQLKSGDEQAFFVLQKGLPLQDARVRFVSHQGWIKEAVSDEQGRVSFQILRDYFPPWNDFQKRFKATFLLIAEANAAEAGRYQDQPYANVRYQATLSGSYYPSPEDYRSYAWGLGVALLIALFCGTAVYLYRRRRVKPFREVRFDDAR
ncbi:hypothetical protein [Sulfurimicrobium lacus]|nr:hypothetical protein [Sulfurimicrobium lacus]